MSAHTLALLEEVSEFLDPYVDVRDGSDGPLPNKAMSLKAEVDREIERLSRSSGPGDEDKKRLDFLEKSKATVYRSITSTHWVFVDERRPMERTGIIGTTLREAIDAASNVSDATPERTN